MWWTLYGDGCIAVPPCKKKSPNQHNTAWFGVYEQWWFAIQKGIKDHEVREKNNRNIKKLFHLKRGRTSTYISFFLGQNGGRISSKKFVTSRNRPRSKFLIFPLQMVTYHPNGFQRTYSNGLSLSTTGEQLVA
eukprot:3925845-Rhodomonas_salina.1